MPGTLRGWVELAICAAAALVMLAIGAAATFWFGFASAVLICAFIGWITSRGDLGQNGEGAFVVVVGWILLVVGIAVGLLLRLVLP